MLLNADQRSLIERLINTVETGRPEGNYGAISIYADGPHNMRQITYGRAQTTEYGNLRKLVQMYVAAGGSYGPALAPYAEQLGSVPLTEDMTLRQLLRDAGRNDPLMRQIQDRFFAEVYFNPAMQWADENGFVKALSALVIYDSYIHSGQILWLLRQKFSENTPAAGGSEPAWIKAYVTARHAWLSNHSRPALQKSNYRTAAYLAQIAAGNWDLAQTPVRMNGTDVYPAA